MTYDDFFANAITRLHDERCHRVFANLERTSTCFPHALWDALDGPRKVIIWCSNDYLGMGQHPEVIKAMVETATRMGVGQGGRAISRGPVIHWSNSSGNSPICTARPRRLSSPLATSRTQQAFRQLPG